MAVTALVLFALDYVAGLLRVGVGVPWFTTSTAVVSVLPLGTSAVVLMVLSMLRVPKHTGRLCEVCVSRFPVDGPGLAVRRSRFLRLWHWERTGWGVSTDVGLLTAYVVTVVWLRPAGVWSASLFFVYVAVFLAGSAWVRLTHRQLEVWCPQCRRGGRGPRGHVPSPVPVISPSLVKS